MIKWLLKWLKEKPTQWLEGEPVPKYLSGNKDDELLV